MYRSNFASWIIKLETIGSQGRGGAKLGGVRSSRAPSVVTIRSFHQWLWSTKPSVLSSVHLFCVPPNYPGSPPRRVARSPDPLFGRAIETIGTDKCRGQTRTGRSRHSPRCYRQLVVEKSARHRGASPAPPGLPRGLPAATKECASCITSAVTVRRVTSCPCFIVARPGYAGQARPSSFSHGEIELVGELTTISLGFVGVANADRLGDAEERPQKKYGLGVHRAGAR